MAKVPCFSEGQVEALARALGEFGSATVVSRVIHPMGRNNAVRDVYSLRESAAWR